MIKVLNIAYGLALVYFLIFRLILPDRKIGLLLKEEALQGWMDKDDEH